MDARYFNDSNVKDHGFSQRPLALHERAEEVLVGTDHHCVAAARIADRIWRKQCGGALHLHTVLILANRIVHRSTGRMFMKPTAGASI